MGTKGSQRHILGRKVSFLRISLPTVAKDIAVGKGNAGRLRWFLKTESEEDVPVLQGEDPWRVFKFYSCINGMRLLFKDERCKCKTCGNIQHQPTVISPSILTDVFLFPHPLGTHGGGMRFRMVTCALPSVHGLRAVASMEKWGFVSGHPLRNKKV
ncbi:hypothetical protein CK203_115322 [Vitis vinifera]|uniref:Uncharacterized protein n=1 Tax=Vitis vinifera TaxID=29760 RepID=A0A438D085_VITVI|nr:hypothetical protein CK203_115322 [Vitis vinifera]